MLNPSTKRYMLKGSFSFSSAKNNLSLVATDGRRLAVARREMNISEGDEGEFILPSLTVSELEKLPGVGESVSISFTDRQVAFEPSKAMRMMLRDSLIPFYLVSKVVEGKYPNYKQVIPKDDFNATEIEELMQECVHRAAWFPTKK